MRHYINIHLLDYLRRDMDRSYECFVREKGSDYVMRSYVLPVVLIV